MKEALVFAGLFVVILNIKWQLDRIETRCQTIINFLGIEDLKK